MPLNLETPYFKKVLVGDDGSVLSEKAVDVAIRFGIREKSSISVLAVARLPDLRVFLQPWWLARLDPATRCQSAAGRR